LIVSCADPLRIAVVPFVVPCCVVLSPQGFTAVSAATLLISCYLR
jgi:hypothetical protein